VEHVKLADWGEFEGSMWYKVEIRDPRPRAFYRSPKAKPIYDYCGGCGSAEF
jgi:hypothetical protein